MFLAAGGSPPAATRALSGIEPHELDLLEANWARYSREIAPLIDRMRECGAAWDKEVFGTQWEQLPFYDEVARPMKLHSNLLVDVSLPHSSRGFLLLGRGASREFDEPDIERIRQLRPALCVSDVAMRSARSEVTSQLDETEQEIVKCVRLGYTNRQTAIAIGMSPFTVRNRLSELYTRFGVGSRAELIGIFAARE